MEIVVVGGHRKYGGKSVGCVCLCMRERQTNKQTYCVLMSLNGKLYYNLQIRPLIECACGMFNFNMCTRCLLMERVIDLS